MENGVPWSGSSSRADVGGEHGADGGARSWGWRDRRRLRHGALHGLGEGVEAGLEQVFDQDSVAGLAPFPEHGGAVGEQLACGGDPEGVDGVLLAGDEGGSHGVEVAGVAGFEEGRPAWGASVEGIEKDVAPGIEEGLGVASHLVVDDAALAALAYLLDEVGDEDGLAGARGSGDERVAGLGARGPGDAGDAVGPVGVASRTTPEARGRGAASELPAETSSPPRRRRPRLSLPPA